MKSKCTVCKKLKDNSDFSYDEGICMTCNGEKWATRGEPLQNTNSYDGYTGYNEGLGVYVRSKSHYKELVKETGSIEIG